MIGGDLASKLGVFGAPMDIAHVIAFPASADGGAMAYP